MNYNSTKEILALLKDKNLSLKKRFGQNFLISQNAREKIINILDPGKTENIWEIGPGIGAITNELLGKVNNLIIFEIDRGFIEVLKDSFGACMDLSVIEGDFLKTWEKTAKESGMPDKIVGNLPYSYGSSIIGSLIEKDFLPRKMVFTFQKEVAARAAARPGTKNYSSFSLICQFSCNINDHGNLNPGSFFPSPGIISSIVEFTPHKKYDLNNRQLFFDTVHDLFASRRKTIKNSILSGILSRKYEKELLLESLKSAGIDPSLRGETLEVEAVIKYVKEVSRGS